jgi:hypothetical protein
MYPLFFMLTIIHRIALVCILIAFAVVPLVVEVSILTNFVVFPSVFILLSISTIYIENTLNKYKTQMKYDNKVTKHKKCLIRYGICCFHH